MVAEIIISEVKQSLEVTFVEWKPQALRKLRFSTGLI